MRGCVVLALEEWVVLYIIDTRRSLDLGLFCFPSTIQAFSPIHGLFMVMVILWLDFCESMSVNALALLLGIFFRG